MHDWLVGSDGKWVTMGVASDGSYGIPQDIDLRRAGHHRATASTRASSDLPIDDFSRERMNATLKELEEERAGVASLLG